MSLSKGAKARLQILCEEHGINNVVRIEDDGTIVTSDSGKKGFFGSFGPQKTIGCTDVIMTAARGIAYSGDQSEVGKFKSAGAEYVLNSFSNMNAEIAIRNLMAFDSISLMPKVKTEKSPEQIKKEQEEAEKKKKEAEDKKAAQLKEQEEAKKKKEEEKLQKQKEYEDKQKNKEKLPFSKVRYTTDDEGNQIMIIEKEMMDEDVIYQIVKNHIKAGGSIDLIPAGEVR